MNFPAIHFVFGLLLVSFSPLSAGFVAPTETAQPIVSETDFVASVGTEEPPSLSAVFSEDSTPVLASYQPAPTKLEPIRQIPEPMGIIALISTGVLCLLTYRRLGKQT